MTLTQIRFSKPKLRVRKYVTHRSRNRRAFCPALCSLFKINMRIFQQNYCVLFMLLSFFQLPIATAEPHYSTPVRHRRNLSIGTPNIASAAPTPPALTAMNRTMDERTTASLLAEDLAVSRSFSTLSYVMDIDTLTWRELCLRCFYGLEVEIRR